MTIWSKPCQQCRVIYRVEGGGDIEADNRDHDAWVDGLKKAIDHLDEHCLCGVNRKTQKLNEVALWDFGRANPSRSTS